ncbi:MAG: hypothetical protein NTZ18_03590 [Candidatus Komeilibacteria bacterium]|nr:hypothetical protein [Candidatus Komeilibacteria bacterium]
MPINKSNVWEKIILALVFIAGAFVITLVSNHYKYGNSNNNENSNQNQNTNQVVEPKPSEFPDYDFYQKDKNKIELVASRASWVQNGVKIGEIKPKFKVTGQIVNGYLFVDASADNGGPLTIWDSVYVTLRKLNYMPIKGGHLFRKEGFVLKVPPTQTTQLLYSLKEIPYIPEGIFNGTGYSENKTHATSNWIDLFKDGDTLEMDTFLSTARSGGMINKITIAWECAEATPDCKLEPIN